MSDLFKSAYSKSFALGLVLFITTAFFSAGYDHPDEHFQILEFANYKLGNSPASDLPWEFQSKIRPALQPLIAFLSIKFMTLAGIGNPFTHALVLRLFTAILAWYIISKMTLLLIDNFSTDLARKYFLRMNFFLWFLPYMSVRFSSETLAGLSFLSTLYCILVYFKNSEPQDNILRKNMILPAASGFLLGLSFFFRFQMGAAILGLGIWLLFIKKIYWKDLLTILLAGLLCTAACIFIDYWFYGTFEITPLNYFISNIIQGKASGFGVSPWWYYFVRFTLSAIPPISLIMLILFILGAYKNPWNVFTVCFVFFLMMHLMIGHKEMRFMTPLSYGFIFLTASGLEYIPGRYKSNKLFIYTISFVVYLNMILLCFRTFAPADERVGFYKFLYNYSKKEKVTLLCMETSLYKGGGEKINFYNAPNINMVVLNNFVNLNEYLHQNNVDSVLVLYKKIVNDSYDGYKKEKIYSVFPDWALKYNINNWQARSSIWSIYKITRVTTDRKK